MIEQLDCTIRDGGYINNWRFNNEFIDAFTKVIENDCSYVEIGFVNKTNKYKNKLVGNSRVLNEVTLQKYKNYKFKKVVMADYKDINIEILNSDNKKYIDLVRIAFHKNDMLDALAVCSNIKNIGYKVSVNAMAITNYNESELQYLLDYVNNKQLDALYIADSYGSLKQTETMELYKLFNNKLNKNVKIGFHLHNNMNNAYGNYEYLKNLTRFDDRKIIFDTTMFGMGRGAGNLQTELVILYRNPDITINNLIKYTTFIERFIRPFYKNQNEWGYDLDYLISGHLKMHPNYIVKMRDLKISMLKRFLFIEKIIDHKINYKYFDIENINTIIETYKEELL